MNIIDRAVLEMIYDLEDLMIANSDAYVSFSMSLGGSFALLYIGYLGLKMLSGDESSIDVMSVLRPFAFGLVIFNWVYLVGGINQVFSELEAGSIEFIDQMSTEIDDKQIERDTYKVDLAKAQAKVFANFVVDEEGIIDNAIEGLTGVSLNELAVDAVMWRTMIDVKVKRIITDAVEMVGLAIFSCFAYIMIFIKVCFMYILAVLGPIAFAFSIIPKFGDAYINWISRYISVSFYGIIAYIIMFLSLTMVLFALEQEIEGLTYAVAATQRISEGTLDLTDGSVLDAVSTAIRIAMAGSMNEQVIYLVCLLLGTLAMLAVPVISTWILQTSGAGQAIGKMASGATKAAGAAAGGV